MVYRSLGCFVVATLALCLGLGCGSGQPRADLSGTVTFKGSPVPEGFLSFAPNVSSGGKGEVKVLQIKDGKFDSKTDQFPGLIPGPMKVRIAGFNGKKEKFWPQGKQIFNPIELDFTVPTGTTTKDFEVPESAGKNVKIEPTADE